MVTWWDGMEEIVRDRGDGPWFHVVSDSDPQVLALGTAVVLFGVTHGTLTS